MTTHSIFLLESYNLRNRVETEKYTSSGYHLFGSIRYPVIVRYVLKKTTDKMDLLTFRINLKDMNNFALELKKEMS